MNQERASYLTFKDTDFKARTLRELVLSRKESEKNVIWSARLSTGLFGLTDCSSGNRGPKGWSEVILAEGDEGVKALVNLGFIPCPSCKPENTADFWKITKDVVREKYHLTDTLSFANKQIVSYDTRRLDWEAILPLLGTTPNRLYLPLGLKAEELVRLKQRFETIGFSLPPVGFYDSTAHGRFREYNV